MTIRILIADDLAVVAEGLKHLIEAQEDLQVVAIVGDGREAVRIAKEAQPHVVLMDLSMPELNGADATRAIVENDPKCRVIVLSMYAEREYVRRALKSGAAGYVVKEKDGRRNRYHIQAHLPLPEPTARERTVGEVLALLTGTETTVTWTSEKAGT